MYDRGVKPERGVGTTGSMDCDSIGHFSGYQVNARQQQHGTKPRREASVGGVYEAGVQRRMVACRLSVARSKALHRIYVEGLKQEQNSLESQLRLQRQHLGLLASNHWDLGKPLQAFVLCSLQAQCCDWFYVCMRINVLFDSAPIVLRF